MTDPGEPALLHGFFLESVRLHADRVAIDVPPARGRPRRTMTYAELDRRSDAIAARLRGAGERIVAIRLPRDTPDLFAAQIGALKAGAAYTCIDRSFPDDLARFVLEDTDATAVLTDIDDLLRREEARPPDPPSMDPRRLAYVIYTSGTTGRQKGVMVEHGSIANLVGADRAEFGLGPGDRVAQGSSPAYDSSVEETWLALAAGATLVVMDDEAARLGPDLVPWLQRERVTVLCPPPTLLRAMGCADPQAALPGLRLLYVGGEALPQDLADRWAPGRRLENGYGPTECTVTVTRGTVRAGEPVSIGRPVRGNRAWVLDDALEEVAAGTEGELCIGGIGLARGYRNLPGLTEERFPSHPRHGRLYRTGDLVRRDAKGTLFYLGRKDAQVKLRGHRVELPAIEAHLAALPGVREAACALRDGTLAAFVVPERPEAPPDAGALRDALAKSLPPHMVPARFHSLDRLPTSVGGKLDRRALPAPAPEERDGRAPRDPLEARIARAVEDALSTRAGIDDDFFLDLGGDSLAAAAVVTDLRADPETACLTTRDIYEARTIEALAERARTRPAATSRGPGGRGGGRPVTATIVQAAALLAGLLPGAAAAWAVASLALPFLLRLLGVPLFLLALPLMALAATAAWAPLGLLVAVLAKRLLVGTYRPLRAPVWGSFHVRNWVVQQAVRLFPWGLVQGTVLLNAALRALGAHVGARVHIHRGVDLLRGGWDLLSIGDGATVAQDATLGLVELDDGQVVVGPVAIGDGATVDVRAGVAGHASLGAGACLAPLSRLAPHRTVPAGERWDGVPAEPAGPAPAAPPAAASRGLSPLGHGLLLIAARFAVRWAAALPMLALLAALAAAARTDADPVLAWLFDPRLDVLPVFALAAWVPLSLLAHALALRAARPVRAGTIGRWSAAYVRIWIKTSVVAAAGRWLSGTLFWPAWLRLAGMRVGRGCEVSTIVDVVPECVSVGDGSFLADGIYLGGPRVDRGTVTVAATHLGRNTFLGNHVVVPAGQRLPDDLFAGVCTVTDAAMRGAWFGHPAFPLPRRAVVEADRSVTHEPGLARRVTRLFWETLRFALPVLPLLVTLGWLKALAACAWPAPALWLLAVPGVTLAAAAAPCALVLALKWLLLGRVRPGLHPLWSCWCSRWDFLYVAWAQLARGVLSALEGTLLLAPYLRAMGARIGRRVVLGSGFAQVVDPDMLSLGDGATVCGMFQAHTFEDRVLKIGPVSLGAGCTVGPGSVLLCNAAIGQGARVAPHAVVMKGERLLPGRAYDGCPVRPAT